MEKKARLGRGIDALFSGDDAGQPAQHSNSQVALEAIDLNPMQPRKTFDNDEITSLSDSIKAVGVLQPLVVRQMGERYQLISGERRLRAARQAGLSAVPVTVLDFNDQQVLEAALIENIQRADLNPIEKAQGFKDYLARFEMTHEQLAGRLGLGRATITNLVALLDLPAEVQELVRTGQLSTGHAKLLKGLDDRDRQVAIAKEIVNCGLSVSATAQLIKEPLAEKPESPGESRERSEPAVKTAHVQSIEDELRQKLSARIEIKLRGKDRGQIVLAFESNDDFERLLEVLRR